MHEDEIRDKLAENLSIIEPGLNLVATNFRLPNDAGSIGKIDILAKDTTGAHVIIEINSGQLSESWRPAGFTRLRSVPRK
ncbi:endonuclease NucS domain-containing protein [Micromonospora sp. SH-82]|uniref:endonuclease NucS domain-containing protein n=1 Tax=Micromonospora sp. SH-82 TaxID=3132938 RepID=UPI003EB99B6E